MIGLVGFLYPFSVLFYVVLEDGQSDLYHWKGVVL